MGLGVVIPGRTDGGGSSMLVVIVLVVVVAGGSLWGLGWFSRGVAMVVAPAC